MRATASQTIGPYWHLIHDADWWDLTRFGAKGGRITIEGRVIDGAGAPVSDAAIELFQASPARDAAFPGYGRAATDPGGAFRFATLVPQPLPAARGANASQAPHCGLAILARGLMKPLFTRLYFDGEPLNETDPVLNLVEPVRRGTLIARQTGDAVWYLDIVLQGEHETVFLEF